MRRLIVNADDLAFADRHALSLREHKTLPDPRVRERLDELGIEPIGWRAIA